MDGRLTPGPAQWGGWSSALITLSSAVLPHSLTTPTFPLFPCCLYIGMSLVHRRRQPAIYASEQVCIRWHRTDACYTDKVTFFHSFSIKVWVAYFTNMRIIFEFFRYVLVFCHLWSLLKIAVGQVRFALSPTFRNGVRPHQTSVLAVVDRP